MPEVWVSGGAEADHWVDITDVFDRKLAALREHASQTSHLGDGLEKMLREWNGANAAAGGLPLGHLAEAYQVLPTA